MPTLDNFSLGNFGLGGPNTEPTFYAISGSPNLNASSSTTIQLPAGASQFIAVSAAGVFNFSSFWNGTTVISLPGTSSTAGYAVISADRKTITIRQSNSSNSTIPYNAVAI